MFDIEFNDAVFESVVRECVPAYQQQQILAVVIGAAPTMDAVEDAGMRLLGEKTTATFVVPTRGSAGSVTGTVNPTIWNAIKNEVYDLLCTKSAKYTAERKEGVSALKHLVTIVATAIGTQHSLPVGIVAGAVSLCIMCALKMTLNAYCAAHKPS